jgi:hypothetical protein
MRERKFRSFYAIFECLPPAVPSTLLVIGERATIALSESKESVFRKVRSEKQEAQRRVFVLSPSQTIMFQASPYLFAFPRPRILPLVPGRSADSQEQLVYFMVRASCL